LPTQDTQNKLILHEVGKMHKKTRRTLSAGYTLIEKLSTYSIFNFEC